MRTKKAKKTEKTKNQPPSIYKLISAESKELVQKINTYMTPLDWAYNKFVDPVNNKKSYFKICSNTPMPIDLFFEFCLLNKFNVECLYHDAIAPPPAGDVVPNVHGVYHLSSSKLDFMYVDLLNPSPEESAGDRGFLVQTTQYETFMAFKMQLDSFFSSKDIVGDIVYVPGGMSFGFESNLVWDDFMADAVVKNDLEEHIDSFLVGKEFYESNNIPWKTVLLLTGPTGTGKSAFIKALMSTYHVKPVTFPMECNAEALKDAFMYAQSFGPSLLYLEDLELMVHKGFDLALFFNFLENVAVDNGLMVVITAKDIKNLKNILGKPMRFNKKVELSLPDVKSSVIYLSKLFGSNFTKPNVRLIAEQCVKNKFSYAHMKELHMLVMLNCLNKNKQKPLLKDVEVILTNLAKDKNSNSDRLIKTEKYLEG